MSHSIPAAFNWLPESTWESTFKSTPLRNCTSITRSNLISILIQLSIKYFNESWFNLRKVSNKSIKSSDNQRVIIRAINSMHPLLDFERSLSLKRLQISMEVDGWNITDDLNQYFSSQMSVWTGQRNEWMNCNDEIMNTESIWTTSLRAITYGTGGLDVIDTINVLTVAGDCSVFRAACIKSIRSTSGRFRPILSE